MPGLRITASIALACAVTLCTGCGERTSTNKGEREPAVVFRLALELNSGTKLWAASDLFRKELAKASPEDGIEAGEIRVEFYDQGMIGTERQLLEACYFGVVEVIQINSSVVSTVEPSFLTLDLPFLFVSDEHLRSTLNGEIGQELLDKLRDHRLQGLGFYTAGFRNMFYQTDGPCAETPEQLEGLKIRVMESPVMVDSINAIGASATPIPFSELYQALKTGVVDGAENSAEIFVAYKYSETGCNCFTLTEHFTNQHIIIANATWLDSLEPKYRRRIQEVAREIVPEFNLIWDTAVATSYKQMESEGVTVNTVRSKRPFIDEVQRIPEEFFQRHPEVPRDVYEKIRRSAEDFL